VNNVHKPYKVEKKSSLLNHYSLGLTQDGTKPSSGSASGTEVALLADLVPEIGFSGIYRM
jgi:hypothetical protein